MGFLNGVLMLLLLVTAVFLIILVLIQRGKGGGLAGAFGGMGGQSAFGTKAGDTFTKITIGVAAFWIILCAFTVWQLGRGGDKGPLGEMGGGGETRPAAPAPLAPGKQPEGKAEAPAPPAKSPAKEHK
jgi:preprotein translocase subunit SecG